MIYDNRHRYLNVPELMRKAIWVCLLFIISVKTELVIRQASDIQVLLYKSVFGGKIKAARIESPSFILRTCHTFKRCYDKAKIVLWYISPACYNLFIKHDAQPQQNMSEIIYLYNTAQCGNSLNVTMKEDFALCCVEYICNTQHSSWAISSAKYHLVIHSQYHKTRKVWHFCTALSVSTNYYKIPKTLLISS